MDAQSILKHVDHTLLSPCATWGEVEQLCEEGLRCRTASVCIPPSFVARAAQMLAGALPVCTVIGFPLGYGTTASKLAETEDALLNGASEIDMVVNLGDVKDGRFDAVLSEIAALKKAAGQRILKVIIETCYLTEEEKIALCRCVTDGGADFIKTSTGFGTAGAQLSDIELFKRHIGPGVRIKASGGMRTRDDFEAFLAAGAERLGTSAAVKVLESEIG